MENRKRAVAWGLLSLLPLLMILVAFQVRKASGPYWLSSNLDPTYDYLMNALNLANGHRPFLTEHPGTPVQVTGGLIIRALNGAAGERATAESVISNPEYYIRLINSVFIIVYALCLLMTGWVAFSVTGEILSALAAQAIPFISSTVLAGLIGFRPEPVLISISTLFVLVILLRLKFDSAKYVRKFSLAFGVLAGIGVASKFTFIPLALMPLILLPSWKDRIRFALISIVAFVLSIAPIIAPHQLKTSLGFVFQTTVHTGRYGGGPTGFINSAKYLHNAIQLVKVDAWFFIVVTIGLLLLIVGRRWLRPDGLRYRALLAVSVAEIFQLLLVAKEPTQRYLIPALALGGFNLILLLDTLRKSLRPSLKSYYYVFVAVLFISISFLQFQKISKLNQSLASLAQEQLNIYHKVENEYRGIPIVRYYTASSPMYAFRHGCEYSNNFYGQLLQERYPNNFFYSPWNKRFHNFAVPVDVSQIANSDGWFIMHGLSFKDRDFQVFPPNPLPDNVEIESLYNGDVDRPGIIEGEAIYKATLKDHK